MDKLGADAADFKLLRTRAEFIKKQLESSSNEEYDGNDIIVKDLTELIYRMDKYAGMYLIPIRVQRLPKSLFGVNTYKKADLIYRAGQIMALTDSALKSDDENKPDESEAESE